MSLIKIFNAGPDVSLNGSPTVSPTTEALWASDPLFKVSLCRFIISMSGKDASLYLLFSLVVRYFFSSNLSNINYFCISIKIPRKGRDIGIGKKREIYSTAIRISAIIGSRKLLK